jgi:hypothetical protein
MFRFSIRDLLWLTVLMAIGTAWYVDRASLSRQTSKLQSQHAQLQQQLSAANARLIKREQSFDALVLQVGRLKEEARKHELLDEAEPGAYFLNPLKPLLHPTVPPIPRAINGNDK